MSPRSARGVSVASYTDSRCGRTARPPSSPHSHRSSNAAIWPMSQTSGLISGSWTLFMSSSETASISASVRSRDSRRSAAIAGRSSASTPPRGSGNGWSEGTRAVRSILGGFARAPSADQRRLAHRVRGVVYAPARLMPVLLTSRPIPLRVVLAGVIPAAAGALAGWLLGVNETAYLVWSVLALLGGYLAGLEHRGAGEGAIRGVLGGSLFGAVLLLVHQALDKEPKADLPDRRSSSLP